MGDFIEPFRRSRRGAEQANSPIQSRKTKLVVVVSICDILVLNMSKVGNEFGPFIPLKLGWKEVGFAREDEVYTMTHK
jgi:hypothetical protein